MITFDEFQNVELRTARVLAAAPHKNADKLIVVQAYLGEGGVRQVVAGIRPWYPAETLVGRTIVIVANLEPVKLRGVESQGMMLAVKDGENLRLLTTDMEVSPGSPVS